MDFSAWLGSSVRQLQPDPPGLEPSSACSRGPTVAAEIPRSPAHQILSSIKPINNQGTQKKIYQPRKRYFDNDHVGDNSRIGGDAEVTAAY